MGVGICEIRLKDVIPIITGWISERSRRYICVTSVHGVMESQRDENIRSIHNSSGLTVPDGMPLVWLLRLKGYNKVKRVYGPTLMLKLCEFSTEHGYKHFLYGGHPGVPDKLKARLEERFAGLNIVKTYSPPFRPLTPEEDQEVIKMINDAKPDIVWVGLSTPKQEKWMAEHVDKLNAPALIGVGAAFDFISGRVKQAPIWMRRSSLEWLFRLMTEPRRLWRRYARNNPLFLVMVLMQFLGIHKKSAKYRKETEAKASLREYYQKRASSKLPSD